MKKLSELSPDTMLTVEHYNRGEFDVMTKESYLNSAYYLDYPLEPLTAVTVACKSYISFDIYETLYNDSEDDTYEGWYDDVESDLKYCYGFEIDDLTAKINEVLKDHPNWWEGESVEIDMIPPSIGEQND